MHRFHHLSFIVLLAFSLSALTKPADAIDLSIRLNS